MGLFDKKFCDVCGEKIGLLGNRKLEDGNLCKDCARKLSPFFSERRSSTVDEIKQQLAYREENKSLVPSFHPTKTYGNSKKVYVDMNQKKFIVTSDSNWKDGNPDIIDFSQVTAVNTDVVEHKDEIYYKDNEGNNQSYNPRRYEYEYEFTVEILVDSPWFSEIEFELSSYSNRPDSRYSPQYCELERMANELVAVLTGQQVPASYAQPQNQNMYYQQGNINQPVQSYGQPQNMGYQQGTYNQPQCGNQQMYNNPQNASYGAGYVQSAPMGGIQQPYGQPQNAQMGGMWMCQSCGTQNTGKFCQNCGNPQPQIQKMIRCDKCGWMPQPGQNAPKFCPECGDPIDFRDM